MKPFTFLGINGNKELVFFESWNELYGGAYAVNMVTLTQNYIDKMNEPKYVKENHSYLWYEAVANHDTELGLDDFIWNKIYNLRFTNKLFVGDDPSFRCDCEYTIQYLNDDLKEKVESIIGVKDDDYAALSCVSCGSLFLKPNDLDTSDWLLVADPSLIQEIISKMKKNYAK